MKTAIIIPSRLNSSRLSEKALRLIGDKSLIQWVYEACIKVKLADLVIIATDHQKIFDAVLDFGGKVMMTSKDHKSGTDRCAEVAATLQDIDYIINVQGDEPFIDPANLDLFIDEMKKREDASIFTLYHTISEEEARVPSNVKLVKALDGKILYFSRSMIPFQRDKKISKFLKHVGIYGFDRKTLLEIAQLPPSLLELTESLEQLRWLENGYAIYGIEVATASLGIDTEEDLAKARQMVKNMTE